MNNRDLTADEVTALLDERGNIRPDTIPIVAKSVPSDSSFVPDGAYDASSSSVFSVQATPPLAQFKAAMARAARIWSGSLAQPLRTTVDFEVEDAQVCHIGLSSQYELPGCIQVLHVNPLDASLYLQIDRGLVFGMIDRLLGGGKSAPPNVRRGVTEIESNLLLRITSGLWRTLEGLFPGSAAQSISTVRFESDPQCVPLQQSAYYQMRIRAAWENCVGTMRLVLPEALLRMLAGNADPESDVAESLPPRGISVVAGQIKMRREEAERLKVGDTILVTRPGVRIYVDRKRMYSGKLGSVQQHKAVRIEGPLES